MGTAPRWLLGVGGSVMLGALFLPVLEVMGESNSLWGLAWSGFHPAVCWSLCLGGIFPLAAALLPRPAALVLGLLGTAPSAAVLVIARREFGAAVWLVLRTGAWCYLAGVTLILIAALLSLTEKAQHRLSLASPAPAV